jgi:radical SAM protein with 4Fe4S-binding SPASM domain
MAVSIEPTTACNLRCPQCPSGLRQFTRPTGNLKKSTNQKILDGLGKNLQFINYYFQGEPFINPHFLDLVKEARKRNIYVLTSTNAHFISKEAADNIIESGINEVVISIDGTTQEAYENYRVEGELQKVIDGTKHLVQAKKKYSSKLPLVTFQFLVSKQNEHQIEAVKKLGTEIGVDRVNLKTIQIYDYENGNDLIPENEKYSRYKKLEDGSYQLKNKYRNSCWRMWSSCVITWDGRVVPCCFDKDAKHKMGEMTKSDFKEIWKSDVYYQFRNQVFRDRKQIEICKNCSEGSKIWI